MLNRADSLLVCPDLEVGFALEFQEISDVLKYLGYLAVLHSFAAALLVFLAAAAGTGVIATYGLVGRNRIPFVGLCLCGLFLHDIYTVDGVYQVMLNVGQKTLEKSVPLFLVGNQRVAVSYSLQANSLAHVVHH